MQRLAPLPGQRLKNRIKAYRSPAPYCGVVFYVSQCPATLNFGINYRDGSIKSLLKMKYVDILMAEATYDFGQDGMLN